MAIKELSPDMEEFPIDSPVQQSNLKELPPDAVEIPIEQPQSADWAITRGFKNSVGQAPKLIGSAIEGLGAAIPGEVIDPYTEAISRKLSNYSDNLVSTMEPIQVPSYQNIVPENATMADLPQVVSRGLTYAGEAIGQGMGSFVPQVAGMAAGGVVGAGAGLVTAGPAGAVAGGVTGMAVGRGASSFGQSYGEIFQALKEEAPKFNEKYPDRVISLEELGQAALIPGAGAGALDYISFGRLMPVAKDFASFAGLSPKEAAKKLLKSVFEGGLTEGSTEAAQQGIQVGTSSTAFDRPVTAEEKASIIDSAIMGGLSGGVMKAGGEVPAAISGMRSGAIQKPPVSQETPDENALNKDIVEPPPAPTAPPALNRGDLERMMSEPQGQATAEKSSPVQPSPVRQPIAGNPEIGDTIEHIDTNGQVIEGRVDSIQEGDDGQTTLIVTDSEGNQNIVFGGEGETLVTGKRPLNRDDLLSEIQREQPKQAIAPVEQVDSQPLAEPGVIPQEQPIAVQKTPKPDTIESLQAKVDNIRAQAKMSGWNGMLLRREQEALSNLSAFQQRQIDEAAAQANPEPTEAQKESGNYKKGHIKISGFDVAIENAKGSVRRGVDSDGESWQTEMPAHYGYIKRTEGADGDAVDVYIGENPDAQEVFIVDQIDNKTGKFDEHKVMLGFNSSKEAGDAYKSAFSDGSGVSRVGAVHGMTVAEFKDWLKNGNTKKPLVYQEPVPSPVPVAEPVAKKPERKPKAIVEPPKSAEIKKGEVGMMLTSGQVVTTSTGRQTTPFPKFSTDTPRKTSHAVKNVENWLMQNALAEAQARGDEFNALQFQANMKKPSQADKDSAEYYLFGDTQPVVQKSIFRDEKPVVAENAPTAPNVQNAPKIDDKSVTPRKNVEDYFSAEALKEAKNQNSKSREILIDMPIDDFLALVPGTNVKGTESSEKVDRVAGMIAAGEQFNNIPMLTFVHSGEGSAKIISHEGRHRAAKLSELGFKTMPVVIKSAAGDPKEFYKGYGDPNFYKGQSIRWGEQSNPKSPDMISGEWPETVESEGGGIFRKFPIKDMRQSAPEVTPPVTSESNSPAQESKPDQEMGPDVKTAENQPSEPENAPETGVSGPPNQEQPKPPSDEDIETAIRNAKPWKYLDELKDDVRKQLSLPENYDFGMRVYSINKALGPKLIKEAGWLEATQELLQQYENKKVYVLRGVGGVLGERTETATIKATGKGGYLALPLGARTKGYYPNYIKPIEGSESAKPSVNVKVADKTPSPKTKESISDFGEKIEGAKKDLWKDYAKSIGDELPDDLKDITLSKHFPEPNYEVMIANGVTTDVLAAIKAMRDIIPSKPQKSWKLKEWASKVKTVRELSKMMLDGKLSLAQIKEKMGEYSRSLSGLAQTMELYSTLGYPAFTKAKGWSVRESRISKRIDGEIKDIGNRWVAASGEEFGKDFDTKEQAIDYIRSKIAVEDTTKGKKQTTFEVYRITKTGEIVIGKKIAAGKFINLKGGFKTGNEARLYMAENGDELIALYEKKKDVPPERRSVNDPRRGEDYRNGEDVSVETLAKTFGFRGIQFGNYVEQKRRAEDINNAYDAMKDMAAILGVPENALSLEGTLGLAFGARGGGNFAAAHYERGQTVINLTKKSGAGSLAHEWFHAFDHNFGKRREGKDVYITESAYLPTKEVRKEVTDAFADIVKAIRQTGLVSRSEAIDKTRSKDYWSTVIEMAARSFEAYIIYKAEQKGGSNDYLANVVGEDAWKATRGESETDSTYPYPTEKEMSDKIAPAFDKLFDVLETKDTDKGAVMFSLSSNQKPAKTETKAFKDWFDGSKVIDDKGDPLVVYHGTDKGGFESFARNSFFSTNREFSEDYGSNVYEVYLAIKNPFDTSDEAHLQKLFDRVGSIEDPYDGTEYDNATAFITALSSDTWEAVEQYKQTIKGMGFDGIRLFEGGVENFLAFEPEQIKSVHNRGTFDANDPRIMYQRNKGAGRALNQEKVDQIVSALNTEAKKLGLPENSVVMFKDIGDVKNVPGTDKASQDGGVVDGFYYRNLIYVSLTAKDYISTLNHEVLHYLKAAGALQPEWDLLLESAAKWRKKYNIDENYADVYDGIESKLDEEAIAHALQDYSNKGILNRVRNKIIKYFNMVKNVLTGRGFNYKTPQDVFDDIMSGEIGRRRFDPDYNYEPLFSKKDGKEINLPLFSILGRKDGKKMTKDEQLRQAIATLDAGGLADKLRPSISKIASYVLHPHQIASLYESFTPVYQGAIEMMKMRDVLVHKLSKNVHSYNKMNRKSKAKIDAVLEIGRLSKTNFKPNKDGLIVVKNEGFKDTVWSKDGDEITLSDVEVSAYEGVRAAMDLSLDAQIQTTLEEYGFSAMGIENKKDLIAALAKEGAKEIKSPSTIKQMQDALKIIRDIEDKKRKGYIPFKRWGEIGIVVRTKGEDAELTHFERVEIPRNALFGRKQVVGENKAVIEAVKRLREKYPSKDFNIHPFEMKDFSKLKADINLTDLDVLKASSEMTEEEWDSLRGMLSEAMQKRGYKQHFLQSNDVSGYSGDFERAINDYIVSVSGHLARRVHTPKLDAAVSQIEKKGEASLFEYARKYVSYITDPVEEWAAMRQMVYFWYLAGNVASGVTNSTQPLMVTAPWFKAMFSHGEIAKQMSVAYKDTFKIMSAKQGTDIFDFSKAPDDVRDALIRADAEGDFLPKNTHDAMAIADSNSSYMRGAGRRWRQVMDFTSFTFSAPERANRVVTYISAYRFAIQPENKKKIMAFIARDQLGRAMVAGKNGAEFAEAFSHYAVMSTQLRMGKLNRPTLSRGVGTLPFQFMSFSLQMLELMHRLSKVHGGKSASSVGMMLFAVVAMAGVKGIPFEDDLQKLFESAYKTMTRTDIDIDSEMLKLLTKYVGKTAAQAIVKGAPYALANLDMSTRLGYGNLVPDNQSDLFGVWFDMFWTKPVQATKDLARGEVGQAFADVAPAFIRNPIQAYLWSEEGVKSASTGDTIIPPENLTAADIGVKMFGWTSSNVSGERSRIYAEKRASKAVDELRSDYYDRLARAYAGRIRASNNEDDELAARYEDEISAITIEMNAYNETAPDYKKIDLNNQTLKQRINEEIKGASVNKPRKQARGEAQELREVWSK